MIAFQWKTIKTQIQEFFHNFNKCIPRMTTDSKEVHEIANHVDTCKRDVNVVNVVGASASITGGLLAIGGLIASPFTFGASLALTGVGFGVGAAGGAAKIGASVSDCVIQKKKSDRVKETVELYGGESKIMSESLYQLQQSIKALIPPITEIIPRPFVIDRDQAAFKTYRDALVFALHVIDQALQTAKAVSRVLLGLLLLCNCLAKDAKDLQEGSQPELAHELKKAADAMDEEIEQYRKAHQAIVAVAQSTK